jgi:hypothetical protein
MLIPFKAANWIRSQVCIVALVSIVVTLHMIFNVLPKEKVSTVIVGSITPYLKIGGNNTEQYLNLSIFSYIMTYAKSMNLSLEQITSLFRHHANPQMNTQFHRANGVLETLVECVGPLYNQSCLYTNLYYVNSTFMVLTIKGRTLPNLTVSVDWIPPLDLSPSKREFDSYAQLESFVREVVDPTVIPDLTVYHHQLWSFNVAHALFDGLYPAYVSLIRFAPRHLHPFRLLASFFGCKDCWNAFVCSRFAGLGILDLNILKNMSIERWFVFDSLIMGNGKMCQRCMQSDMQLPGGIELEGSKLFRDRMYERHGLLPPATRNQHSAENRSPQDLLIAYVINNKRYTDDDKKEINAAINEINDYTDMYLNKPSVNITKMRRPLIHIYYLDYGIITGHNSKSHPLDTVGADARSLAYEQTKNRLEAQLQILRKMDIHVTGPGTGQFYQTFLPDGSVTINLGGLASMTEGNKTIKYTMFVEQYVTAGTPYIKGLYYPINERTNGIKKKQVIELVEEAAKLIMDGFSIPVAPKDNLAADAHLFMEMCEKDKDFCTSFTERTMGREIYCMDSWLERFVHEDHVWRVEGVFENGRNITCPFNRTLLKELRKKYHISH